MSTPPFLDPPPGTDAYRLATSRGHLAVLDAAPADDVPRRADAVLVPGFTGSKEDFVAIVAGLASRGHRVVAIDQRGQHESTGPDDETAYELDELVRDLLAVVEALDNGPVHLLGHSFGGLVGRAAILADAQAVCSLTLLCSGPGGITGVPAERARLLLDALDRYSLPELWKLIQAVDAEAISEPLADPDVTAFLERRFVGNNPACLRAMARRLLGEPDRVAELAATGVPVLVAFGVDDDAWTPEVQSDMARRLGTEPVAIPAAGHSPAVDAPEATAALLAGFWSRVESIP